MKTISNKKTIFIIVSSLLVLGVAFYWFQVRPSRIVHACSWTKMTLAAVPAEPGITQEQADAQSLKNYQQCKAIPHGSTSIDRIFSFDCSEHSVSMKPPTPAQPEKVVWNPATKDEYTFCLHDKGLK